MADHPYDRELDEAAERARRAGAALVPRPKRPKHPRARALAVAEHLVAELAPACRRIEIAGSLRRGLDEVGDIELVCEPLLATDLFGHTDPMAPCELDAVLDRLTREGRLARRQTAAGERWGPRWRLAVAVRSGIPVDIALVRPPAQWGAILAIRTGPRELSQRLVTSAQGRGLECRDGRLMRPGTRRLDGRDLEIATPEERDFFAACGVPWIAPEQRR